jgi:hypothetical protein
MPLDMKMHNDSISLQLQKMGLSKDVFEIISPTSSMAQNFTLRVHSKNLACDIYSQKLHFESHANLTVVTDESMNKKITAFTDVYNAIKSIDEQRGISLKEKAVRMALRIAKATTESPGLFTNAFQDENRAVKLFDDILDDTLQVKQIIKDEAELSKSGFPMSVEVKNASIILK